MDLTITHEKNDDVDNQSDAKIRMNIGGKEYILAKLRPGDIADLTARQRSADMSAFTDAARTMLLADGERGKGLAEIIGADYPTSKVINHPEGRLRLLHASLTRGGTEMTWDQVRNDIPIDILTDLHRVLLWCSGFGDPGEEANENPTTTTSDTTKSTSGREQ